MKIHRSRHEEHFTIFPNALIRDERLSYRARGVLMELLSRPDDWKSTADSLAIHARQKRVKGEGRDAMRGAFAELKAAGYIVVEKGKGPGGTHTSVLHVHDTPQDVTSKNAQKPSSVRGTGNQSSDNQASADQSSENQASKRRTGEGSTGERSTEKEESFRDRSALSGSIASDQASDEIEAQQRQREQQLQRSEEELKRRWDLVDALSPEDLRAVMLKLEKQRPTIYRKARQDALGQHKGDGITGTPKGVDNLACKFALLHYASKGITTPAFLANPLGLKDTA